MKDYQINYNTQATIQNRERDDIDLLKDLTVTEHNSNYSTELQNAI